MAMLALKLLIYLLKGLKMNKNRDKSLIYRFTRGGFLLGLLLYVAHNMPFWKQNRYFWLIILIVLTSFSYLLGRYVTRVNHSMERDFLTNLYNEKSYHEYLSNHLDKDPITQPLSLVLMDIDGFKKINDQEGHLKGDQILVHFAMIVQSYFGKYGRVFRWGGDEFIIVLNHLKTEQIETLLKEFLKMIKLTLNITSSIGVVVIKEKIEKELLFMKADKALYEAKKEKNCYVIINEEENCGLE